MSKQARLDEQTVRERDPRRLSQTSQVSRPEAVRRLIDVQSSKRSPLGLADTDAITVQYPPPDLLGAIYALESVSGFGPVKFRSLHQAAIDPQTAVEQPDILPLTGKRGAQLKIALNKLTPSDLTKFNAQAVEQIERAKNCGASILTHYDSAYPSRVYNSNNPVPVIYVRGNNSVWANSGTVAVVGSRKTRDPYAAYGRMFALAATRLGLTIVSGFAIGSDSIGHAAARESNGQTVCVMPCGVDLLFPPENRELWNQLLQYPNAAFVSEFRFGLRASALTLRKRNKLIAAYSAGVLVAQSSKTGGAMNAYRFAREQRKAIATFRSDGTVDTTGNAEITNDFSARAETFDLKNKNGQFDSWLQTLSSST